MAKNKKAKRTPKTKKKVVVELPNDVFAEGADAALAGNSITDNPYDWGTVDEMTWNDGYTSIDEQDGV